MILKKYSLELFYKKYLTDFSNAYNILKCTKPKVIYGLHFISNPGLLSAIQEIQKNEKLSIEVLLMQHGFFQQGGFHDFAGADYVILWGNYHEEILKTFKNPPKTEVIGNVKLSNLKINQETIIKSHKEDMVYISSGDPRIEENYEHLRSIIEVTNKKILTYL
ncbi:hypothetical protein [Cytobacillus oceanisediminis]|uniref:hypothetical protein n=1 Tax=Cytobacillus oceanisediminis TaxID=665099 RepID=UPI001FB4FB7D|nr:hypothetical protein [Cytobacillus oceanisediminis]UOE55161.1 hypothetical protein IRB79_25905 [Cytobacillus oceanisediminis]